MQKFNFKHERHYWPIFSESGIVFSVHDLVWPWTLRVMKGHMIQNRKKFVTFDILRCSAFFYTAFICSKWPSFDVIRGQWKSALGQSFDLSLVWPYFHYNTFVFSFYLIYNMPIFKWFSIFQFLRSVTRSSKLWCPMLFMGHKKRCQIQENI